MSYSDGNAVERFQLMAAHVSSHPRLGEVVDELSAGSEGITAAQSDAKAYLTSKGFDFPAGATVEIRPGAMESEHLFEISVCITLPGHHAACVVLHPPISIEVA